MNPYRKELIRLAAPIFIETLLFMLLGVADIYMLSQYNDLAAGAVGAANQLINNLNLIFAIVSAGTAVLVAQNVGAKNKLEIERVSSVSIVMNLILGLCVSLPMLIWGRQILQLMGVTPDLMEHAADYIQIVGGMLFFQALLNTAAVIIRSHGYTRQTMLISLGMNILNIFGDAVLIFGLFGAPVLGAKGVAIATTVSRCLATIVAYGFLFKKVVPFEMFRHIMDKPKKVLKNLVKIGLPAAMENMSYSLSQTVTMSLILMSLGEVSYVTRTYAWSICWFAFLFAIAIGQATQIMIGQSVGAKRIDEAYEIGLSNFRLSFILSLFTGLGLFLFGQNLIGIYTDNPEIIAIGAATLAVDAFLEPGRTFNIIFINGLRGAGDVIFPVVMAMISMWIFGVAGGYFFAVVLGYGLPGFWFGNLLDEWFRGFSMYLRWRSKKWTNKSLV
jgi:putative MATE family efflux protein